MASEGGHGPQTSGQYIEHHLQNLQVCKDSNGEWVWNQCAGNPMAINVDSMFWSVFLGLIFVWLFHGAARKTSADKPGKFHGLGPYNVADGSTSSGGSPTCTMRPVSLTALHSFLPSSMVSVSGFSE